MVYYTYARYRGIRKWIYGWFIVGMSGEEKLGGYAGEFAAQGCDLILVEASPPMPQSFWFVPKSCKILFPKGK